MKAFYVWSFRLVIFLCAVEYFAGCSESASVEGGCESVELELDAVNREADELDYALELAETEASGCLDELAQAIETMNSEYEGLYERAHDLEDAFEVLSIASQDDAIEKCDNGEIAEWVCISILNRKPTSDSDH